MLRKYYLKGQKSWYYQSMILPGKRNTHLNEVDRQALDRLEMLVQHMAEKRDVTEHLKMKQPMFWVRNINTIKSMAEEIVLHK